ncbi:GTP cyclohydrolase I [Polaribacter irgensii 23-P]|uniref:GTP cyclohydrolase I n=1 Tax=Polaribacter irgensii 23-P TaxID=313594 RepID=A4C0L5_9FLAO|nr:GTP cyclohydrolase I [Polaribacter irgensii 23-P]
MLIIAIGLNATKLFIYSSFFIATEKISFPYHNGNTKNLSVYSE